MKKIKMALLTIRMETLFCKKSYFILHRDIQSEIFCTGKDILYFQMWRF